MRPFQLLTHLFILVWLGLGAQNVHAQNKWSRKDINTATNLCQNEVVPGIMQSLDSETLFFDSKLFCDCMLIKFQANYKSMQDLEENADSQFGEYVGKECAKQALSVKKPNVDMNNRFTWSRDDLRQLENLCYEDIWGNLKETMEPETLAMLNQDALCECLRSKITAKYRSWAEFMDDEDEEGFMEQAGAYCALEAMRKK